MSPQAEPEESPRCCPKCGGAMKWYRSDVVPNTDLLEHFFACEQCGHLETASAPIERPDEGES
jgi:DNA-directed RNA polymerase subunit M/transcription elongation factor TFIIS